MTIASVALLSVLASCGSSSVDPTNSESLKDYAIEKATKAVVEEESPIVGKMPSLYIRRSAALDTISEIINAEIDKLNPKDEGEVEEAFKKAAVIREAEESAEEAVKNYYDEEIQKIATELAGKEFPSKFDSSQYSDVKATIEKVESGRVWCNVKLTLSAPLAGRVAIRYVTYEFIDADGNEVQKGAASFNITEGNFDTGGVIDMKISASLKDCAKITAVNFYKSK